MNSKQQFQCRRPNVSVWTRLLMPLEKSAIRKRFTILMVFLGSTMVLAQQHNYLKDVTINPPNVAAMEKYGEIPVSMHTGVPNVGIPIHTLNGGGGLSVPIAMSYHAGGIRVAETASWVGLGWSLSAGGAITRTVRGAVDEGMVRNDGRGISLFGAALPRIEGLLQSSTSVDSILKMGNGQWDIEPDLYSFNVNGYSGKFYFKQGSLEPILTVAQDIQILPNYRTTNPTTFTGSFDSWTLLTPDGTKYTFGIAGKSEYDGQDESVDLSFNYAWNQGFTGYLSVSAWHLTKIETADGTHSISFEYGRERYRYTNRGSDSEQDLTTLDKDKLMHNEVLGAKLRRIVGFNEVVEFKTSVNRLDLDAASWYFANRFNLSTVPTMAQALDSIIVQTNATPLLVFKRFKFNTDYFESTNAGFPSDYSPDEYPSDQYRLRLKSIWELNSDGELASKKEYRFDYINTASGTTDVGVRSNLPRRKSAAQDIWGFYNGKRENKGLLPIAEVYHASQVISGVPAHPVYNTTLGELSDQLKNQSLFNPNATGFFTTNSYDPKLNVFAGPKSGNRQPAFPFMQEGTLSAIYYPTGGSTQFEYEAHQAKSKLETMTVSTALFKNGQAQGEMSNCPVSACSQEHREIHWTNGRIVLPSNVPSTLLRYFVEAEMNTSANYCSPNCYGDAIYQITRNGVSLASGSLRVYQSLDNNKKAVVNFLMPAGGSIAATDVFEIHIQNPELPVRIKCSIFYGGS